MQTKLAYYRYDCRLCSPSHWRGDPSTYREAEISLESKMWKNDMMEEMNSLHKNDIWELSELPKENKAIGCSGYLQRNKDLSIVILYTTKSDW